MNTDTLSDLALRVNRMALKNMQKEPKGGWVIISSLIYHSTQQNSLLFQVF